ncbi:hypothetical protein [Fonticella tunisiensis]|uniref:Uncharacterized protein n=1 Tax=Fonticella tunisiensis TaxID=1096341 RepID=A0A4R7KQY0_9CLOT|nr:hypothetical protein [Fonticella tunisiensis]TDT61536.1 hypothetical protein EDD71_10620 [Fonticella tunisiensis]
MIIRILIFLAAIAFYISFAAALFLNLGNNRFRKRNDRKMKDKLKNAR